MREPKKFTDASRSEIRPEWKEWYEEQLAERQEELEDYVVSALRENPEGRWPERYGKDVGEGAWVIVIEEPHTEMKARFSVPTPSLWWARPEVSRQSPLSYGEGRFKVQIPGLYRVVIETPGGSLWLYPHEYVVAQNPVPLITDPECTIHPLGGKPRLNEEQAEQMFYLQSRGWAYDDALMALMEGIDMRDWGWVEFPEYAREAFEGVGRRPVLA